MNAGSRRRSGAIEWSASAGQKTGERSREGQSRGTSSARDGARGDRDDDRPDYVIADRAAEPDGPVSGRPRRDTEGQRDERGGREERSEPSVRGGPRPGRAGLRGDPTAPDEGGHAREGDERGDHRGSEDPGPVDWVVLVRSPSSRISRASSQSVR